MRTNNAISIMFFLFILFMSYNVGLVMSINRAVDDINYLKTEIEIIKSKLHETS